ncbi:MAG TPA: tRNA 2-selenouridine(34) synthase MnmH [Saprospiraceae bacterium]|nr:tRNA 2-selenouridine(34) synthase MnmH [Saprospiraceae bacterium]HMP24020.1 tRNA 2-selenouridine(34) synthase MnmH [Saprospiraceae bacterium]
MVKTADITSLLQTRTDRVLLDVRTPAEFAQGHIPGAVNLPLFSDEERAIVGTIYKQQNPELALLKGLELAGQKMRWYVEEARRLAGKRGIAIHCWRGGKRSESMGWLLGQAGFDVMILQGGYKNYRRFIHQYLAEVQAPFIILGGYTGSGKTEILHSLARAGEQILDLEALAHHKGSAFGALGKASQPTVEQFENELFEAYLHLDKSHRIWIEDESKSIGRVYIPAGFWQQMVRAPHIKLEIPLQERIQHLVNIYATFPREKLIESFTKIKKRLGGQHLSAATEALERADYAEAARIALVYYDKTYAYGLQQKQEAVIYSFQASALNFTKIANDLIHFADSISHHYLQTRTTDC